jgi:hypothetical protein
MLLIGGGNNYKVYFPVCKNLLGRVCNYNARKLLRHLPYP